jgi:hypothetical protein
MKKLSIIIVGLAATTLLSACNNSVGVLTRYKQHPDTVIATSQDFGLVDSGGLEDGQAAIAYDPDGCQGWIIDDGIEGYSGRRFDPVTGLPVCNNLYPPGTVIKDYQSQSTGLADRVPYVGGTGKKRKVN